ncbi:MAG TPA: fatty acyl-AMP ligase [Kofleriaceae bacterium]|nr:fatty acyl-AMP ligase [Kofleriaceae bacterium]
MAKNLNELVVRNAREQAARLAYVFLRDGERDEIRVTWSELDRQARVVAARLRAVCDVGDRALLLFPPGIEFIVGFLGCLYAGVVAVPAYPPDPTRLRITLQRLQVIAADCRARAVLGTTRVTDRHAELAMAAPALRDVAWIATDSAPPASTDFTPVDAAPGDFAFLQYTSGSTAAPKGVIVSHGNILANEHAICSLMELDHTSCCVGWLPLYHDMGLIGNVLAPVYAGFPLALMSPMHFMQSPVRLLRAISRYRGTVCGGPNFAYEHCVNRVTEEDKATLDLSSWRVAYNGSEPIRADTLRRFTEAFASCGFAAEAAYPCYGLAEATLIVSGKPVPERFRSVQLDKAALERHKIVEATTANAVTLTSSGRIGPGFEVEIVEPETMRRVGAGEIGEIWLAGPSVAQGYFGQAEATERTFRARIADDASAGPFLRTGDLGFKQGDNLFVTGRIKDVIVIRGRKLHPQDLERAAEVAHPALRVGGCAAFALEQDGEEAVGLIATIKGDAIDTGAVLGSLRQALADSHQVTPAALILTQPSELPKTSSGKVQRHACREAFLKGTLRTTAVWRADAVSDVK